MAVKRENVLKRPNSPTSTAKSKKQSTKVKHKTAAAKEQISKPDDGKVSAAIRKPTRTPRKAMSNSKNKPKSEKKVKEESVGVIGMRRSTRLASRESV